MGDTGRRRRASALVAVLIGLTGWACQGPATKKGDLAGAVGDARRVAAGDVDGDRRPEIVVADARVLRVIDAQGRELARAPAPGGAQVLRVADIDGDGRGEILAGWGRARKHLDARARVSVYRLAAGSLVEEVVSEPATSRDEVVEILPIPNATKPELLVAHFESKYMVRIARARRGQRGWSLSPIDSIRMATSFALGDVDSDGEIDLIVGRVYGDDRDADGDAFISRPDRSRVPIPVKGGVRSLAVADLDGDGRLEVLLGDGWNKNYGKLARARLTRAWWSAGGFRAELLEQSPGQYTLWDILPADLDGDGSLEIVTRGDAEIRILRRQGDRWQGTTAARACRDAAVVDLDDRPGDELLVACDRGAKIVRH